MQDNSVAGLKGIAKKVAEVDAAITTLPDSRNEKVTEWTTTDNSEIVLYIN